MRLSHAPLSPLHVLCALLLCSTSALATGTLNRAYVSAASGNDANPCTQAQPCRTINAAVPTVIAGGEVLILDSGGYGSDVNNALATITQSVAIVVPPGLFGGLSTPSGVIGVNINAPGATVTLRGLSISAQAANGVGVSITAADKVNIENCVISNFTQGVEVTTDVATSVVVDGSILQDNSVGVSFAGGGTTARNLTINNSLIEASSTGSLGINVQDSTTTAISNTRFVNQVSAIFAASTTAGSISNVTVRDSLFNKVAAFGMNLSTSSGGVLNAYLSGNTAVGNAAGSALGAIGTGTSVWLSGNRFAGNANGVLISGGATVYSHQDNTIVNNTTDVNGGTLTATTGQ